MIPRSLMWLVMCSISQTPRAAVMPDSPAAAILDSRQQKQEFESYYKKWLEEDVVYIISAEEKDVFLKLTVDEERDRFIEQFWARRDRDTRTPENEYKEEHYRRIQYANEHFHAGIPGWRTDRGRIYIVYGPPDRIETHPVGGQYLRPAHEGGGQTSTYPFERWEYRHIEGIGEDIEIEFVDSAGGNLFEIATNPFEKDELLYVPGMGLTDRELMPGPGDDPDDIRRSRVLGIRDAGSAKRMGIYGERAKYSPFARTELAANLSKPPVIRFNDLRAEVEARITYNRIPVDLHYHCIRLDDSHVLIPLVMSVPNEVLTFEKLGGLATNRLQVYGRVTALNGVTVYEFDDEIVVSYPLSFDQQVGYSPENRTIYRRPLALQPGRYKLDTVVREVSSGEMGTAASGIFVPSLTVSDRIKLSPLALAENLDKLRRDRIDSQDYLLGQFKILPKLEKDFHPDEYLAFYFEIYDYQEDPSTNSASVQVEYAIVPKVGETTPVYRDITRGILTEGDRILVPRQIGLATYPLGDYELHIRVKDLVSGQLATQTSPFRIQ